MNKAILSRLTWGATLLLIAACTEDNAMNGNDPTSQQLAVTFATRSTGEGTTEAFATGDHVKLFATMGSNTESTVFTLGSGGSWLAPDGKNYLASTIPATLTAVYPATATDATKFTMDGVLSSRIYTINQSTDAKLKAADFMTSEPQTFTTVPTEAVGFTLKHRMCKVTISITDYGTEFGSTLPSLGSETIYSKGYEAIYSNGIWGTNIHSDIDAIAITPLKTSSDNGHHKYEAIVSLGTYEAGDNLMTLTVNGKTLNVRVDKETYFTMGNHYTYTLKVGEDYVKLTSMGTYPGGWGDADSETEL